MLGGPEVINHVMTMCSLSAVLGRLLMAVPVNQEGGFFRYRIRNALSGQIRHYMIAKRADESLCLSRQGIGSVYTGSWSRLDDDMQDGRVQERHERGSASHLSVFVCDGVDAFS
jgi:hypothetical protein